MNEWIFIKARRQPKWAVSFYGHWHRPSRWLDIFLQPNLQIKRSIQIELLLTQIYLPKSTNISVIVRWQVRYDLKQIIFNYFRTKLIFASTPQIMHQNISEISLIVLVPENPGFDPSFCHKMIRNCSVLSPSLALKQCYALGGSPGLVFFFSFWFSGYGWWLMFERLWVRIMAPYTGWALRHCFTFICCKNCNVCLKRPKINENEAGVGQI